MNIIEEQKCVIMQKNLKVILKAADWKQGDLADMLGCSRQTISTLCNCDSKMSYAQYLAIRYLLLTKLGCTEEEIDVFCVCERHFKKRGVLRIDSVE